MDQSHDRRRNRRLSPPRRRRIARTTTIGGLLWLALAAIIAASASRSASAFAPPSSSLSSNRPMTTVTSTTTTTTTGCADAPTTRRGRIRDVLSTAMGAKKRRRKTPSSGDGEGVEVDDDGYYVERDGDMMNIKRDRKDAGDDGDNRAVAKKDDDPPIRRTTLSGGPSLIFEMARRMLVWDDELYDYSGMLNDAGGSRREGGGAEVTPSSSSSTASSPSERLPPVQSSTMPLMASSPSLSSSTALPRWRPSAIRQQSISNVNPAFRTSSPVMTNAGYAGILRRNSRKRNKPSMWRHCLRVYGRMAELEKDDQEVIAGGDGNGKAAAVSHGGAIGDEAQTEDRTIVAKKGGKQQPIPGVGTNLIAPAANARGAARRRKRIRRSAAHHEAALVAASKLGLWEEALLIYRGVEEEEQSSQLSERGDDARSSPGARNGEKSRVTDNMIISVVKACVKGSSVKRTTANPVPPTVSEARSDGAVDVGALNATNADNATERSSNATNTPPFTPSWLMTLRALTVEERRKPLDAARDIIHTMEEKHNLPLVSRHVNPLAAAYVRLGLRAEAAALINDHLEDRPPPPPPPAPARVRDLGARWKERRESVLTSENPGFEGVHLVDWSNDDLDGNDGLNEDGDDDFSDGYEEPQLNVHQLKSKDRGSYALLVKGAAMDGDWTGAVEELRRMTDAGLHPNSRNLNSWSEVVERGCRPSGNGNNENGGNVPYYYGGRRRRRSWKKKRDGIWLGNLR